MTVSSAHDNNPAATLDNFLSHRVKMEELVQKNIIKDPKLAPSLQQQAEDLHKKQLQDALRHKIDHRPTKEELIEHNILKKDSEE